jgi:arabinose-5-phosphate isomerase
MIPVPSPTVAEPDRVRSASVDAGRRVLRAEADALIDLARSLDERFERCVEMIAATRGRVVVTGMG